VILRTVRLPDQYKTSGCIELASRHVALERPELKRREGQLGKYFLSKKPAVFLRRMKAGEPRQCMIEGSPMNRRRAIHVD
jgi:hypothetical protein